MAAGATVVEKEVGGGGFGLDAHHLWVTNIDRLDAPLHPPARRGADEIV